jgi:hypothetical protein
MDRDGTRSAAGLPLDEVILREFMAAVLWRILEAARQLRQR